MAGMISATSNMNTVRDSSTVMPGEETEIQRIHSFIIVQCNLECDLKTEEKKLWLYF